MCSHSSQPSRKEICIRNRLHSVSFCLLTVFDQNTGKRVILVKVGALNHLQSDSVGFIEFEHPKALLFLRIAMPQLGCSSEGSQGSRGRPPLLPGSSRQEGWVVPPAVKDGTLSMPWRWSWLVCFWYDVVCVPDLRCIIDRISMGIPQYSTLLFESIQFFTIYYTSSFSSSSFR